MSYLERGFELRLKTLKSSDSPLTRNETDKAVKRLRQNHSRRLLSLALLKQEPVNAMRLAKSAGLGVADLLSGLRRYQ
jgi:hypothetical protein